MSGFSLCEEIGGGDNHIFSIKISMPVSGVVIFNISSKSFQ